MRQSYGQSDPAGSVVHNTSTLVGTLLGAMTHGTATGIRRYRLGLGAGVLLAALIWIALYYPPLIAWPVLLAALVIITHARERLTWAWHAADVKREWERAIRDCGLTERCWRVRPCAAGDRLDVRISRGRSVQDLQDRADALAACLQVSEVHVARGTDASRAQVTLVRRDPFDTMGAVPWPGLDAPTTPSVWDPIQVGVTEEGDPLTITLVGNQILVGGITGGGKSVFLRPLLATAAQDPNCKLWLFDGKLVELAPWAKAAEGLVGRDGEAAVKLLEQLEQVTDQRQDEVLAADVDRIGRTSGLPIHVIVVDEVAQFTGLDEGKRIMDLLRSIASRGRALGVVCVLATQYPHGSLIDTTLRGQLKTIVGFRCRDRHQGVTIFGQEDLARMSAEIPERLPGVGYMLDEGGSYVRFRSVLVKRRDPDDPGGQDDVRSIVKRAARDRDPAGVAGLPGLPRPEAHTPKGYVGSGKAAGGARTNGRGKPGPGRQTPGLMGVLADRWDGEPLSQAGLARLVDRSPTDGSVRRAVRAMQEQGLAARNEEGLWVKTD